MNSWPLRINMSCNAAQTMAVCGETSALFDFEKYELLLKGDRCSNLPHDHHPSPETACIVSYCVWIK